jgi:phospholipid/cholesterol/gamma-HCH transport system ATP-binding protein
VNGVNDQPILRVRGVVKSFAGFRVLDGVDLDLRRGETIAVLGPSGCGKTVLLKCIIGLIAVDGGEIEFDGASVTAMSESERLAMRRRVGLMFQYNALFDSMTVAENVAYGLHEGAATSMDEADIEARVAWALDCVGLSGTQSLRPEELSGGMRKRVGLARTMALRPEVILYDEPTMGLDPINAHRIGALIQGLHTRFGIASLMVTHDMALARTVSDRAVMLLDGRVAGEGPFADLVAHVDVRVRDFVTGRDPDER